MSQPANDDFSNISCDEESKHEVASGPLVPAPNQLQQEMELYLEYIVNEVWKVIQMVTLRMNFMERMDCSSTFTSKLLQRFQAVEKEKEGKEYL
ncbi:hypothetical protein Tco_0637246 [Tanacetum coccineum]